MMDVDNGLMCQVVCYKAMQSTQFRCRLLDRPQYAENVFKVVGIVLLLFIVHPPVC
jgi:hypothetical protein